MYKNDMCIFLLVRILVNQRSWDIIRGSAKNYGKNKAGQWP